MSLLLFMLPMMLGAGVGLLAMLLWAVRHGQFEDLEGEKHRIFFDDGEAPNGLAPDRRPPQPPPLNPTPTRS